MRPGKEESYAVITGASQGLGAAFAEACASRGWNLVLAALPGEGLGAFAESLRRRYGVYVAPLEIDLSIAENQDVFIRFAEGGDRRVGLLVNNVGVGPNGFFDRIPAELQRRAVDVNIQSTLAITYGLIPRLRANRPSSILTVASLSAYYPMPLFAVYAASKAFLLNWSLALRHELFPLGIGVTALAPGGVYTSPEIREKVSAQGLGGRLSTLEPEEVAERALAGLRLGRAVVIPGAFNRLLRGLGALCPRDLTARLILGRWGKALGKAESVQEAVWCERDGDACA